MMTGQSPSAATPRLRMATPGSGRTGPGPASGTGGRPTGGRPTGGRPTGAGGLAPTLAPTPRPRVASLTFGWKCRLPPAVKVAARVLLLLSRITDTSTGKVARIAR